MDTPLTPDSLRHRCAWLNRHRRAIEFEYIAAYLDGNEPLMNELSLEHQRLVATITTLGRWIAEAELYEAQRAAVREAEQIIKEARFWAGERHDNL